MNPDLRDRYRRAKELFLELLDLDGAPLAPPPAARQTIAAEARRTGMVRYEREAVAELAGLG